MSDSESETAPYGTWSSPISAEQVARAGIDFGHTTIDDGTVYWREQRPDEDGRGVVVRHTGDTVEDVTPESFNARTLVHQYGGGDFAVADGTIFVTRFEDQRVYRHSPGGDPVPITPEPETERGLRYADFEFSAAGESLYCVRENHDIVADEDGPPEPETSLVLLDADESDNPQVVATGHDFYAAPTLSPAGDQLAWLTWDHPQMPWDGTELHVADVDDDGTLSNERLVMGGPDESVFQPAWRSDGTLHAVSDRSGWWNLYRRDDDDWTVYRDEQAEYGVPQWVFGLATYAFFDDGRVATVVTRDGEQSLEVLTPDGVREQISVPFSVFGERGSPQLLSDGEALSFIGSSAKIPSQLVRWTADEGCSVLRESSDLDVDLAYTATPDHISVPTRDGEETHAFVYPPTNPDVIPPDEERPPLIVFVHGGPTSATTPTFDLSKQFFTSRGFAVADVNYRGSTGYGRAYRDALDGEWGVIDVQDCLDVAQYLAEMGQVDGDRLAIRGGSAGGFATLAALAFHDELAAGASYFGVSDLERLAELTHKFESRYLDSLVGPYPDAEATYKARSPVHHAADIDVPVLLLQGDSDQIVPLSQAESMASSLAAADVPHHLRVFEDEQHGFRRAVTRQTAHETELAFYGQVFDFDPAETLPDIDLSTSKSE